MATVHFTSSQRSHTGGVAEVEVDAAIVKDLIAKLEEMFPGIGVYLDETSATAVAINGDIMADAMYEPVPDGAEIHFLPPIPGG